MRTVTFAGRTVDITIDEALRGARTRLAASGVESPGLDSEVLLAVVLGCGRSQLLARGREELTAQAVDSYARYVQRRATLEPVAYITGFREFYGLRFKVTPAVLIPRPETEHLVDAALRIIHSASPFHILDIGTGSGCVAVAIATEAGQRGLSVRVAATDISPEALSVAQENIRQHGLDGTIQLALHDASEPPPPALCRAFDLVVSNPPYVPSDTLESLAPDVTRYEPHVALDGGRSGLDVVRAVLRQAAVCGRAGATALVEIGFGQEANASELADAEGLTVCRVHRDLAGVPRVLECKVP